jgi:enamine deaminase RidA (YjgF/YER057c/UK114 family)
MTPEQVLEREGLTLPMSHPIVANYAKSVRTGALVFVSGRGPFVDGTPAHIGRVGAELTLENGRKAAEAVIMNIRGP